MSCYLVAAKTIKVSKLLSRGERWRQTTSLNNINTLNINTLYNKTLRNRPEYSLTQI